MDSWAPTPRNARLSARTAALLVLSGAVSLLASETTMVGVGARGTNLVTVAVGGALLALSVTLWVAGSRLRYWVMVLTTQLMVLTTLALDLYTRDAGGGAQVAFLFPVVYAGAFLRPAAAWTTACLAVVCDAVVTFTLLPVDTAVTDTSFVIFATAALTAVLTASGRRQRELVAQLQRLVAVDALTGLATRRDFEDRAATAVARPGGERRGGQHRGTPAEIGVGMLIIDIDRFKQFNDAHGHPRGDAALVHVASVLRAGVRDVDTVARLGGDELAVLLVDISPHDLAERAEALRAAVSAAPLRWTGAEVHLTISVGVAHTLVSGRDPENLYATADAALYRAKRAGRDQVAVGAVGGTHHQDPLHPIGS